MKENTGQNRIIWFCSFLYYSEGDICCCYELTRPQLALMMELTKYSDPTGISQIGRVSSDISQRTL